MNIQKVNVNGETAVRFTAFYPFVWIKNIGNADAYAANFSGFDAGDNDVACIPAGEAVRLDAMSNVVYIKSTGTTVYAHAQNIAESPFLDNFVAGGEEITVEPLSVTQNGTYTAEQGTAYSPVTVDVQEQPWQPLQDGYSNFWFELTDDTLSPWLNFSAKNSDAVIDWGDGSGEVALDTLTPTHTYAKAGRYVVKVKGVTGIARQFSPPFNVAYNNALKYVELNSEVTATVTYMLQYAIGLKGFSSTAITGNSGHLFSYCPNLSDVSIPNTLTELAYSMFQNCFSIKEITIPNTITTIGTSVFNGAIGLTKITLPSAVASIGNNAFVSVSLAEIHVQATTPPTLGTNVFTGLPSDFIIYVPQGTGETYKAAAGWSAYSDHILEEGETVTRAMQRKFEANALKAEEAEIEEKR